MERDNRNAPDFYLLTATTEVEFVLAKSRELDPIAAGSLNTTTHEMHP
jgi:hypothetical protein